MPMLNRLRHSLADRSHELLAMLLGALAFGYITGGRILRPNRVEWLLKDDPATGFLGWQFFRQAPLLQFPLGANPGYGTDFGSSVVYTDSLPLLALLFKPFSPLLPSQFQYFGLWLLACFVLQALFACKLIGLFCKDKRCSVIGAAFFVLAPVFLWRLHGHYALVGQWIILASLYLYFSPVPALRRWALLLSIASLVHAYLLVMAAAIWGADLLQRVLRKQSTLLHAAVHTSLTMAVLLLTMWAAGYFMVGGGLSLQSGIYRMNLLSLIDSDNFWSRLMRDREQTGGDYEGFNFLGVGMLICMVFALAEFVQRPALRVDMTKAGPIGLACLFLALLAVSNHVALGTRELFAYQPAGVFASLFGALRASGRMFWPVYYAIYLAVLIFIFSRFSSRASLTLCTLVLVVHIADSALAVRHFRKAFRHPPAWSNPIQSSIWTDFAKRYGHIVYVLPYNQPKDYLPIAYFAAKHGMTVNVGYFARTDPRRELQARQRIAQDIREGRFQPKSLYVFEDEQLWQTATRQADESDFTGIVDGFRALAPEYFSCATCSIPAFPPMRD
jgi:hypothetical protein